jgi:hypothetical protein
MLCHHTEVVEAAVLVLLVTTLMLVLIVVDLVVMDYRLHGTKQLHYLDITQAAVLEHM